MTWLLHLLTPSPGAASSSPTNKQQLEEMVKEVSLLMNIQECRQISTFPWERTDILLMPRVQMPLFPLTESKLECLLTPLYQGFLPFSQWSTTIMVSHCKLCSFDVCMQCWHVHGKEAGLVLPWHCCHHSDCSLALSLSLTHTHTHHDHYCAQNETAFLPRHILYAC